VALQEEPTKEAIGQISTLLFIRNQLHEHCFANLKNISFNAMLNQSVTIYLDSLDDSMDKRLEALKLLTMTDGELLYQLLHGSSLDCQKLTNDIILARPYPCRASFGKQNLYSTEIMKKVRTIDKSIALGFSKYFDKQDKQWLHNPDQVPDAKKGYAFSDTLESKEVVQILEKAGIDGAGYPSKEEGEAFAYWRI
jgi:hypothetical protein